MSQNRLLRQLSGTSLIQLCLDTQVLQSATRVAESELDRCVADIMKEKNICREKDTRCVAPSVMAWGSVACCAEPCSGYLANR